MPCRFLRIGDVKYMTSLGEKEETENEVKYIKIFHWKGQDFIDLGIHFIILRVINKNDTQYYNKNYKN